MVSPRLPLLRGLAYEAASRRPLLPGEIIPASIRVPALAKTWAGTPPMWLASGEEQLLDGGKAVARRAALQGVNVTCTQFEAMLLCFVSLPALSHSRQAEMLMIKWATFCKKYVNGTFRGQQSIKALNVTFKDTREQPVKLKNAGDPLFDDIERMIYARVQEVKKAVPGRMGHEDSG